MSEKILEMQRIVDQYSYLNGEFKSIWTKTHDDGECNFHRVMEWLESEDNRYQMELMIKLARDAEKTQ